jgi:hypothetical protein
MGGRLPFREGRVAVLLAAAFRAQTYGHAAPAPVQAHRPAPSQEVTHPTAAQSGSPGGHGLHAAPQPFPAHAS